MNKLLPPIEKTLSVDEYRALPKNEREKRGFYRRPLFIRVDNFLSDYDAFEKFLREEYPVQWFFREWLFGFDNPVYCFFWRVNSSIWDFFRGVKAFIKPHHRRLRKAYPRHKWVDLAEAIEDINFAIILDFWHEEVVDGPIDWQSDRTHISFYNWLKESVEWIEGELPKLEARSDKTLSEATDKKGPFDEVYKDHNAVEEEIRKKKGEILVGMMNHREMFWT